MFQGGNEELSVCRITGECLLGTDALDRAIDIERAVVDAEGKKAEFLCEGSDECPKVALVILKIRDAFYACRGKRFTGHFANAMDG